MSPHDSGDLEKSKLDQISAVNDDETSKPGFVMGALQGNVDHELTHFERRADLINV